VVARQIDVLIIHHPHERSVAERLRGKLSQDLNIESGATEGDIAGRLPGQDEVRAVVVVVGEAVAPGVVASLDHLARRSHLYLLVAPGPWASDLGNFPRERTFGIEQVGELAAVIARDIGLPDTSESSSDAPQLANAPPATPASSSAASKTAATRTRATGMPPLRSEEESGAPETLDPSIFSALDGSALAALGQAARLARLGGASRIHMDHLFVGLYREPDGPTYRFFAGDGVTADELGRLVKGISEPIVLDPPMDYTDEIVGQAPPAISRHVGAALRAARDIASINSSKDRPERWIASRHLLYGALSVDRCSLVKALRRDGRLDKDRIDLADHGDPSRSATDLASNVDSAAQTAAQPGRPDAPADADAPVSLDAAIAGFASDDAKGPDLLDIRREVDALGKVIAARDVVPPLAIGLFGDWGTGKTFFMKRLQRRIRTIAQAEKDNRKPGETPVYCQEIVQLEFNAWTYIEENLWASLASAIFDGLDASLTRRDKDPDALRKDPETLRTDEFDRARILTDRAAAQHQLDVAQQAKAEADRHVSSTEARLKNLESGSITAAEIVAGAWTTAMSDQATKDRADKATTDIKDVATDLHLDPASVTRDLRTGGSIGSRLMVVLRSLFKGWRSWVLIAGLALVIVAAVAALPLAGLGGIVATVGVLTASLAPAWRTLGSARAEYLAIVKRDEAALETERKDALERAAKAQAEIDTARKQVLTAETSLENLRPSRQLANFVSGRHGSADYRSRLGVVAQAREDFEQLTQLITKGRATDGNGAAPFPPSVDRIILYIDDLDRCREKEVVDVLQAVHLLLAFRLFVVVVAVDPRWLVHSLRVQSRVLQGQGAARDGEGEMDEDEAAEWQSTPLNYLEKIFQVPYAIRPMGESGFKAMIDNLVGPTERQARAGSAAQEGASGPADASAPSTAIEEPEAGTDEAATPEIEPVPDQSERIADTQPSDQADDAQAHQLPAADDEEEDQLPVEMQPGFLHISDDERTFMGWLHPLVQTPRAAKRFVNVYRILKASVEPDRRSKLVDPAEHRAVLTLLAMLTSHPTETTALLQALVDERPSTDWWSFFEGVRDAARKKARDEERAAAIASGRPDPGPDSDDDDDWMALSEKLDKVQASWPDAPAPPFTRWARDVSRFSFESSRVVLTPAPEATGAEEPVAVRA